MALIDTNAAALAALADKITGDTLTAAEYTTLKDSLQEANTATRTANTVFSGPTTGAAAAATFRALVAADIPSLSAVYLPIGGGTLTGALVLSGAPTIDLHAATKLYVDGIISALNASNLTSGTVPDARFPATLPALNGSALTALNASNLGSGTVPDARFPAVLPAISGANLTNLPGVSGVVSDAATNTVSDALVIQHATSGTAAAGFGTGLLFKGEDGSGAMSDIGAIRAVWQTTPDANRDGDLQFWGVKDGTLTNIGRFSADTPGESGIATGNRGLLFENTAQITCYGAITITAHGHLNLGNYLGGTRFRIHGSTGNFEPYANNTYDIGAPTAAVKDIHSAGRSYLGALGTAPVDADIANSRMSWYLDEAGHGLKFRVRYSDGTLKTGTVALT